MNKPELTIEEILSAIEDLQKITDAKVKVAQGSGAPLPPTLLRTNRMLKQIIVGSVVDKGEQVSGHGIKYGEVVVASKKGSENNNGKVETKKVEVGDVVSKRISQVKKTEAQTSDANLQFINELKALTPDAFRAKYKNLNLVKSVGVVINELEGEEIIPVKDKSAKISDLQDRILSFLSGEDPKEEGSEETEETNQEEVPATNGEEKKEEAPKETPDPEPTEKDKKKK